MKSIKNALISVYYKDGLAEIVEELKKLEINIFSTGGTYDYISSLGAEPKTVESLTSYPSIFGGRVKTLHPKVMGGILLRRENTTDLEEAGKYEIPPIDLVVVDLYPFEQTVASGVSHNEIIEKIDIGGISLIRAAAKNYNDVLIISSSDQYCELLNLLKEKNGQSDLNDRKYFAAKAFMTSSHYDNSIFEYFNRDFDFNVFKKSISEANCLRYGENPHQKGWFFGYLNHVFDQISGKNISYNNLVDIDAAIELIQEFDEPTFAIIKHTNACGLASRNKLTDAWAEALAGDPISAFGGVIICNRTIDTDTAAEIHKLFFEILLAPDYQPEALELLNTKKNRIILKTKPAKFPEKQFKSLLNGVIVQQKDNHTESLDDFNFVSITKPKESEIPDLIFANKIVKHTKSNTIVLAKNKQLLGSGTGQTSRVDALRQAITKAHEFGKDLNGAVMASDAFFPFPDCVEIAHNNGIKSVIQPGGSINDQKSIDYCNDNNISMVLTGYRHFKH